MKIYTIIQKNLFVLILGIIFLLLTAVSVFANNGPHLGGAAPGDISGGFAQDTDGCAGCHRAHTGTAAKLLKTGANIYEFCSSCHNGTGSNANVLSGLFEGDADITYESHNSQFDGAANRGLNAGGFLSAVGFTGRSDRNPDDDLQGAAASGENYGAVTSRHNIEGLDGAGPWTAYGGGVSGYGDSGSMATTNPLYGGGRLTLQCTNCHDPHGSKNVGGSERYRILNRKIKRWDGATPPGYIDVGYIASNEPIDIGTGKQIKDYTSDKLRGGIAEFCSSCHTQYIATTSVYNSNDTKGYSMKYRHMVPGDIYLGDAFTGNALPMATNINNHTKLPVEQDIYTPTVKSDDLLTCLTCHQAHGTRAAMSDNAFVGPAATTTNRSALLRLNNRGVCQDCHQR